MRNLFTIVCVTLACAHLFGMFGAVLQHALTGQNSVSLYAVVAGVSLPIQLTLLAIWKSVLPEAAVTPQAVWQVAGWALFAAAASLGVTSISGENDHALMWLTLVASAISFGVSHCCKAK